METKFTSGEWKVGYPAINEPDRFIITADNDGIVHAHVYGANGTTREIEEAEANAKLIAAAPDLFKACKMAEKLIGEMNATSKSMIVFDAIINAIQKATE